MSGEIFASPWDLLADAYTDGETVFLKVSVPDNFLMNEHEVIFSRRWWWRKSRSFQNPFFI